ncbi:MOSC N-terminal beta barrel domain-containing protein [Massilia sp. PAMC28688]|uniref:MOSC domain-containing protein n=1 Tax=Massilia sp. PAMC28688 TaxID=2861283 RepID=UPI001C6399B4|nr:MOSC N-terminal beta barrel domain-containing protein [Massilia sp. PAMC28688]QYF94757.1 MOSC N-terminal beta barrel domain-containing protein [Massilia sp. PAMC28688]
MAILSELTLYPIKSCAGISVKEATLTTAGLSVDAVYDREWMLVDEQGCYLTQREHPRMALIAPRLRSETLEVRAPGMLRLEIPLGLPDPEHERTLEVSIWDDKVLAYDCDDLTAAWFSSAIGAPCRLVRFHAGASRVTSTKWTGGIEAPTLFSDGYPVLLAGSASLAELNDKMVAAGRAPLPMNRLRPNVVIDGIGAFEEDFADHFALGAAQLKPVKPCGRCPIPAVDQATGVPGPDPLDIMRSFRTRPAMNDAICFGMNCIITAGDGERLYVGMPVTMTLAF